MKLNILIGKAKILEIENDEVENILKFIELHESLTLDLKSAEIIKFVQIPILITLVKTLNINTKMILKKTCPHCHKDWNVELTVDQFIRIKAGEMALGVLDDAAKAEFFITGICPTCWDELFKEEDDD